MDARPRGVSVTDSEEGLERPRTFLFLQGPSSWLFMRIAHHLEQMGHRCLRVNCCAGDWLYWRRRGAYNYRGKLQDWNPWLRDLIDREGVTDIVLLGEERPHHQRAINIARNLDLDAYAIEMGYLRPDWIRIERGGSGFNSHLPVDPEQILKAAATLPEPDYRQIYKQSFFWDAVMDIAFNMANVVVRFPYPHYRWHAIYHPVAEYAGWIGRLLKSRRNARLALNTERRILASGRPYFVMPLQLETDYQIRAYSSYNTQREAIEDTIASMAAHAPFDTDLVVKLHPLDNGLVNWGKVVRATARRYGLQGRVHFMDGGNLVRLMASARGVVTINSTAGLQAVQKGTPVKVLGVAVYDIEGLTHRGSLDHFWRAPTQPDVELSAAFHRLLAVAVHVRGNFYSLKGMDAGAKAIATRLDERSVNQPGAFVRKPPRSRPVKRPH